MTSTQSQPISVPLGKDAHRWAEMFASEQATPQKGKQVYLNTLAVCAVHSYLKWLMVETNLTSSDSWEPGLRAIFNVADLVIPNVGKLECRPVLPGELAFELPMEVSQNRIGYVAVQFHSQLNSVQLLGFARAINADEYLEIVQLAQLQPLDILIETINSIQSNQSEQFFVNLRQWLEGIFNQDWQPVELALAGNFRHITHVTNSVSRVKEIDLVDRLLLLVVEVTLTVTESVNIRLRLYPGNNGIYLPENLQLVLFDEAGSACMEAQSKKTDSWMELEFSCQQSEMFSVKVVLEGTSLTEKFIV
ncbi:hypothetical protein WA1_08855 [Scytonema hofmannii PCC 7110]|uniref:DUF1822 domain-containing protein n=1 Tax=Scytonema hofmannii PCC 7110 TaxID=128403 RepID=A0A139WS38_9CYAN|nr:DUF1822 family protein [Scytonema hofmannii]KYC35255.1 hypothetical protein WA1_08855 [Scytonema hofmannii PCC 7110]